MLVNRQSLEQLSHFCSFTNKLCTSIELLVLNYHDLSGRGWLTDLLLRVWQFSLISGLAAALQTQVCLSVEQSAVLSWTLSARSTEPRESVYWAANRSTLLPSPHYSASGKAWLEKRHVKSLLRFDSQPQQECTDLCAFCCRWPLQPFESCSKGSPSPLLLIVLFHPIDFYAKIIQALFYII